MRNAGITDRKMIDFGGGQFYSERELSQLIRRKMITKEFRNKKKYQRHLKHKKSWDH